MQSTSLPTTHFSLTGRWLRQCRQRTPKRVGFPTLLVGFCWIVLMVAGGQMAQAQNITMSINPASQTFTIGQSITITFSEGNSESYTFDVFSDPGLSVSVPFSYTDAQGNTNKTYQGGSGNSSYIIIKFLPGSEGQNYYFDIINGDESDGNTQSPYTVVAASAPCTPPSVSITAIPSLTVTSGGSVTLTASGADSYTWSANAAGAISNSVVVNAAGTYSVTGSSNGCIGQASATVSVTCDQTIVADAISTTQTVALSPNNCSVTLKGTGYGTGYQITGPGGYVFSAVYRRIGYYTINGVDVKLPGTYTLVVSYSDACGRTSSDSMTYVVTGTACK